MKLQEYQTKQIESMQRILARQMKRIGVDAENGRVTAETARGNS